MTTAPGIRPLIPDMQPCILGEGAYYDFAEDRLLFVDIDGQKIHIHNIATQHNDEIDTPSLVGFVTVAEDGSLVAGLHDGIYNYRDGEWHLIKECKADKPTRFNDGKASPDGRFLFAGTISLDKDDKGNRKPLAGFYRMDTKGEVTQIREGVINSNGIGWSPDRKTMYYIDTGLQKIMAFDYDEATGELSNERDFATGKRFDGMCVSDDGHVLVAIYGEAAVEVFSPQGELKETFHFPTPLTTCPVLGGKDGTTLFVTTASQLDAEQQVQYPSGQVFRVAVPYRAQRAERFKLEL